MVAIAQILEDFQRRLQTLKTDVSRNDVGSDLTSAQRKTVKHIGKFIFFPRFAITGAVEESIEAQIDRQAGLQEAFADRKFFGLKFHTSTKIVLNCCQVIIIS